MGDFQFDFLIQLNLTTSFSTAFFLIWNFCLIFFSSLHNKIKQQFRGSWQKHLGFLMKHKKGMTDNRPME